MPALAYAVQLLGSLLALIQAGIDITSLLHQGNTALQDMQAAKRDPTAAEWDALNLKIKALQAELHSPEP